MKAVLLPNDTALIKDNVLFKTAENLNFRLKNLELTRQVDENNWETVFSFKIAT